MSTPFLRRALPPLLLFLAAVARANDAPPSCKYVNVATLPLRYLDQSFDPAVDGAINGSPAPMLIDTGAQNTMLTRRATDRLDLPLRMTDELIRGMGGETRVYGAGVKEFVIGPTKATRLSLHVIDEMGSKPSFDAIVGADFLFQADFELALAEKELRFFRPLNCKGQFLGYWNGDIYEVPMTGTFGDSSNPTFEVEINGVKFDAIIDSGATESFVFESAARKAGVRTDAPGTVKAGYSVGIGAERVARWSAIFNTFKIGGEIIRNAELSISAAPQSGRLHADMMLGADFLRTHRVLFANSQKKLYISYLGGDVFTRHGMGIAPWLQKEADAGLAAAQFAIASKYSNGAGVPQDPEQADAWLKKAALQDYPPASRALGLGLLSAGHFAEAANRLSSAVSQLPDDAHLPLYLYLARLQAYDAALAARELDMRFAADKERRWPVPIADFYLGRIDAGRLLAQAGKEPALALAQSCEAKLFIAELAGAKGDQDKANTLLEAHRAECARPSTQ